MASPAMHLAIAKKYIEKHSKINYKEFIKGTLYPDATKDSIELHYPKSSAISEFAISVYDKVNLYEFLTKHPYLNDFELGYFLHLVTDYLFFHECFSNGYLTNTTTKDFCKELYHTYDCLDSHLFTKYHITKEQYQEYPHLYYPGIPYEKCLLSKEVVDKFIKRVSSINLKKYRNKILEFKDNVKP